MARPPVGKLPAGITETSRDDVYPHRLDGIGEGPGPGLAARGVGGVAGVEPAAPRGDRDLGGQPGHHQVREQPGLVLLERGQRDVAADHRLSCRDGVRAAVQHIRDGHGQIADQRRVGHVPEVHDSARPQVLAEQHVVQAQVPVDDLGAQARQHRRDPGLEPLQHPFHLSPARSLGHMGQQRAEPGQVGDIPEDLVVGSVVEEAAQGPSQPGRDLTVGADRLGGERRVRDHAPGQEREEPRWVGPAVRPGHLGPGFPGHGGQGTHHGQAGIDLPDMAQRGGLHLQHGPVIRRVGDLEQDVLPVGRAHPEVLVPFGRQGLEG